MRISPAMRRPATALPALFACALLGAAGARAYAPAGITPKGTSAAATMGRTGAAATTLDPKDGPDVDLRVLVEDAEVRLQIITNLAFVDATTEAWREIETEMSRDEAERTAEALVELFAAENRVEIDGVAVDPLPIDPARDFEFDPGDPSLVPLMPTYGALAIARTRLTLRYACKTPPERVAVAWGVYPENMSLGADASGARPPIELMARVRADGREIVVPLTRAEPEYTWHRPAGGHRDYLEAVPELTEPEGPRVPWGRGALLGLALLGLFAGPRPLRRALFGPLTVGAGAWLALGLSEPRVELPAPAEAEGIFRPLHTNIYRAFDFTERSRVYDVLAESAGGDVLSTLYDDVYRSLVMQEEGGAVGRVESVDYLSVDVETIGLRTDGTPTIALTSRWRAKGVVAHWDHAHSQESEYAARYVVTATEAGWRITDYVPLEQRRVDAAPLSEIESDRAPEWRGFGNEGESGSSADLPDEF
ncbi:MAG: hypothetical protein AAFU73_06280 [Planctomycetota bacterium]